MSNSRRGSNKGTSSSNYVSVERSPQPVAHISVMGTGTQHLSSLTDNVLSPQRAGGVLSTGIIEQHNELN